MVYDSYACKKDKKVVRMNSNIDFSIIIPHYNIPDMLERLLKSIPKKDNIEVLVVDDKSDKNLEGLELLKQNYPNVFFLDNTISKGAGNSRNIGLEKARGKWILFADADDYFTENFYEIISKHVDDKGDVVFFFPISADTDTGLETDRHIDFCKILKRYSDNPTKKNELCLRYELVAPWSKLIKRDMLIKHDIQFENTPVANDVMFCRKLGLYSERIGVSEENIYVIVSREGSLTAGFDVERFDIRLDTFIRSGVFVKNNVDPETWKLIHMNGSFFLHVARVNHLGIKKTIEIINKLIHAGIFII